MPASNLSGLRARITRPVALLLLALATGAAGPNPGGDRIASVSVGMGDQSPAMFGDPRFQALRLGHARLIVPWNAALVGGEEVARLDAWLAGARARRIEPLIALHHARGDQAHLPSTEEYQRAVRALRLRYPDVRAYTVWNEANHRSQPTFANPRRGAEFYDVLRAECPGCRIVAADVLDQANMIPWIARFRRYAHGDPRLWGVHNYVEINRSPRWSRTRELVRLVPGEVWVTETGGLVRQTGVDGTVLWPYDERRAAAAVRRSFAIVRREPRISRLYLYQWQVEPDESWDSAFIAPGGQARPALGVLRRELAALSRTAAAGTRPRSRHGGCRRSARRIPRARRACRGISRKSVRRRSRKPGSSARDRDSPPLDFSS